MSTNICDYCEKELRVGSERWLLRRFTFCRDRQCAELFVAQRPELIEQYAAIEGLSVQEALVSVS